MLDLSPGNCNARHDPPPVVRRGSRRLACEDVGRHPLLRFPAYTEIGNECSLVFNEEQRKRLHWSSQAGLEGPVMTDVSDTTYAVAREAITFVFEANANDL